MSSGGAVGGNGAAPSNDGFASGVVTDTKLLAEVKGQLGAAKSALRASQLRCHDAEEQVMVLRRRVAAAEALATDATAQSEERVAAVAANMAKVQSLQSGLVDLVVEVQSRALSDGSAAADASSKAAYDELKERVVARCGDDPLVLLDLLRSTLRVQLAFKANYESEVAKMMEVTQLEQDEKLRRLADEADDLRRRAELAEASRAIAQRKQRQADSEKELAMGESKLSREQARATEARLKAQLRKAAMRNSELKQELDTNREKHEAESLRKTNALLQHQLKDEVHRGRTVAAKLETKHRTVVANLQGQLAGLEALTAKNEVLQQDILSLRAKVNDYKHNARITKLEAAERRAAKATQAAARSRKEAEASAKQLRRAKVVASERLKKIKAMRVEYNKLFRAVQDAQKDKQLPYQTRSEVHEAANTNPYYAAHYKKLVTEKNKEIAKLKSRIQRLMAHEIRQQGTIRSFQFERSRSQAELGNARNEMQHLETTVSLLRQDLGRKDLELVEADEKLFKAEAAKRRWAVQPGNISRRRSQRVGSTARSDSNGHARPMTLGLSKSVPTGIGKHAGLGGAITVTASTDIGSPFSVAVVTDAAGIAAAASAYGDMDGEADEDEEEDDEIRRALDYAGDPHARAAAARRAAVHEAQQQNAAAIAVARAEVLHKRRAREKVLEQARGNETTSEEGGIGTTAAAALFVAGAPAKDAAVVDNLRDLDEQQQDVSKLLRSSRSSRGNGVTRRRRPLSASSRTGHAASLNVSVSKRALVEHRRTYCPSNDATSQRRSRGQRRPMSASVRRTLPVGGGRRTTRDGRQARGRVGSLLRPASARVRR